MDANNGDTTSVWAYGKDGWYCAMWGWSQLYADHLISLGYRVERSIKKPVTA